MDKLSARELAAEVARHTHQALPRPSGADSYMLHCPGSEHALGDKNPSLHIFQGKYGGHGYCQTGCSINDIGTLPGKGFDSIDWHRHIHGRAPTRLVGERDASSVPVDARRVDMARHRAAVREMERDLDPIIPGRIGPMPEPPSEADRRLARLDADLKSRLLRYFDKDDVKSEQRQPLAHERTRTRGMTM